MFTVLAKTLYFYPIRYLYIPLITATRLHTIVGGWGGDECLIDYYVFKM